MGDIVEVTGDQPFPCDLLLLDCQTDTKECHITTANLDGETNLKVYLCFLFFYIRIKNGVLIAKTIIEKVNTA